MYYTYVYVCTPSSSSSVRLKQTEKLNLANIFYAKVLKVLCPLSPIEWQPIPNNYQAAHADQAAQNNATGIDTGFGTLNIDATSLCKLRCEDTWAIL